MAGQCVGKMQSCWAAGPNAMTNRLIFVFPICLWYDPQANLCSTAARITTLALGVHFNQRDIYHLKIIYIYIDILANQ